MDEEKDNLIDNHRDDLQSENKTITTIINYDDEDICKNFVENETINGTSATIHRPFLEGHRDSIWMSMGINMTDEERRKRRMSRRRESLDAEQQLASLG
ncbi:unnamed protein product [Dracunculus medinensis]|uniref:Uncharacterized protein n=1 Tax=Dracunculus medinensis TaxID=318479 RepID=A0A0N4UCY9_DRAME|nr:unnamed protein product [Dracunculus medinensis]